MIKNVKIVITWPLNQSFNNISSLPKKYSTDLSHFCISFVSFLHQFNLYVLPICMKKDCHLGMFSKIKGHLLND